MPVLTSVFPQMSVTTKIDVNDHLLKGLKQNHYQLIITSIVPDNSSFHFAKICTESMFLSVPKGHPFYHRSSIAPEELNGQFLIAYNDIGIWEDWIHDNFPGIHLLTVSDADALQDAIGLGTALSFVSDYVINSGYHNSTQNIIPLDMENKTISYYLVCKKQDVSRYRKVFQRACPR